MTGGEGALTNDNMEASVYIMSNGKNGTLYIGVTNDLIRRVLEHKEDRVPGFTKKYGLTRLVYYECGDSISAAIGREKQLKHWNRAWKIRLIEERNPGWEDLYSEIIGSEPTPTCHSQLG